MNLKRNITKGTSFPLSRNFWSLLPQEVMDVETVNSTNKELDILMSNRSINGYKKQTGRDPPASLTQWLQRGLKSTGSRQWPSLWAFPTATLGKQTVGPDIPLTQEYICSALKKKTPHKKTPNKKFPLDNDKTPHPSCYFVRNIWRERAIK